MKNPITTPNVPKNYNRKEEEAYLLGWNRGQGIACNNVPEIGKKYIVGIYGLENADESNVWDIHETLCFEAEEHSRSYSPFEFIARKFNEEEYPEEVWEAYEEGVSDAIRSDLSKYTEEDYGIE